MDLQHCVHLVMAVVSHCLPCHILHTSCDGSCHGRAHSLRMLFQSTHEERQGADASAEPGELTTKSPLQRTLTAQIMGMWAKHNGAVEHIGVKRSVEMLEMQRAQRFPACPPNPHTSVFAELFPASQPAPSQPNHVQRKKSR